MFDTNLFSEVVEILGIIPPSSSSTAQNSGYISAANHRRFVILAPVGVISATGTLDLKVQMATDSSGTGVIDFPGKVVTQVAAGTINKALLIEIKSDEIPETYTHIRVVLTGATAASLACVVILGLAPRYTPVPTTLLQQTAVV